MKPRREHHLGLESVPIQAQFADRSGAPSGAPRMASGARNEKGPLTGAFNRLFSLVLYWSGRRDSNPRRQPWQSYQPAGIASKTKSFPGNPRTHEHA